VLSGLWNKEFDKPRLVKGLMWSLGITGGAALLFALFGGMMYGFSGAGDGQFSQIPGLVEAMQNERAAMLRTDSWRALLFVCLTAAAVWGFANLKSFKRWAFVTAIGVLTLADLLPVDLRYLSHDDFIARSRVEVKPDDADKAIMADHELGFRVLNTQNPFNEAYTSYFHRSIGGYHGAKLSRYQDVIDRYLSKMDGEVLNMLNAKYYIVTDRETGARTAQLNPEANGAAWFVESTFVVDGAFEEIEALGTIDNKREAVVDKRFMDMAEVAPGNIPDSLATINLTEYRPNYLKYETSATQEQVAVFSEIYYDKGWKAYLDGVETPYFRADYLLRAMVVPAGEHIVEWRFRAPRFAAVEGVTLACSIIILLWLVIAIFSTRQTRQTRKNG
jgi:hypothetical protein